MVKNVNGGNRGKSVARKDVKLASKHSLRLPEDELECMGYVSKMLGNGQCTVQFNDGKTILGQIRNKMRGRNKRANIVNAGSIVMVGLHDWEAPNFKKCDILEVYDDQEVRQLAEIPQIDISALIRLQHTGGISAAVATDIDYVSQVVFSTGDADIMEDLPVSSEAATSASSTFVVDDEIINIDDI
jgi:initiation factor 1A